MANLIGDFVLVKLKDGTFAVGTFGLTSDDCMARQFIHSAYILIMRQNSDGNIGVVIADFMAPFIQNGEGTTFYEKDWIGEVFPMPETLQKEYLQRKTGLVIASAIPNNGTKIL